MWYRYQERVMQVELCLFQHTPTDRAEIHRLMLQPSINQLHDTVAAPIGHSHTDAVPQRAEGSGKSCAMIIFKPHWILSPTLTWA